LPLWKNLQRGIVKICDAKYKKLEKEHNHSTKEHRCASCKGFGHSVSRCTFRDKLLIISPPVLVFTYTSYSPYNKIYTEITKYFSDGYDFWDGEKKEEKMKAHELIKRYPPANHWKASGGGFIKGYEQIKYLQVWRLGRKVLMMKKLLYKDLIKHVMSFLDKPILDAHIMHAICGN
jgi:hypothetical protein